MRSSGIIAAACLIALGLSAASASAATFVVPVPGLIGQYGDPTWEGPLDPMYLLLCQRGGPVDVGAQFQDIQQVRLHLVGTVQPAVYDSLYGDVTVPSDMMAGMGNSTCTAQQEVHGNLGFFTLTFTLKPGATYGFLLDGQDYVDLFIGSGPVVIIGGGTLRTPPVATITSARLEVTGTPVPGTLKGDFNLDGSVDVVDLLMFVETFGLSSGDPGYNAACDLNGDSSVDVADLLAFVTFFGNPQ